MFSRSFRSNSPVILVLAVVVSLCYCATPSPPYGGPKDEIPPQVIVEESSLNPRTNFVSDDEIRVEFDEWVQLNDPANQIVITPPMIVRPEISIKGKTLTIVMPDKVELADNTTYTINFGESIQDITERNPLKNFTYVFSTGDFVDSLSFGATILSVDGEPIENVLLVLHDNPADSALMTLLPTYFSSAAPASGRAELGYLRQDTFSVYALQDLNGNFKYDLPEEMVGFIDDRVILSDTASFSPGITVFQGLIPLRINEVFTRPGRRKITFTRELLNPTVSFSESSLTQWKYDQDTLYLWNFGPDTIRAILIDDEEPLDTISVHPYTPAEKAPSLSAVNRSVHPDYGFQLLLSDPIISYDTSAMRLYVGDSLRISIDSVIVSNDSLGLGVYAGWEEKQRINLYLDAGAVTSIFNESLDSTELRFNIAERANFGLYEIDILNLSTSYSYVFRMTGRGKAVHTEIIPAALVPAERTEAYRITVKDVPVGEYTVVIEEDVNNNGRWDTGSFDERRQPERRYSQQLQPGRPGWDVNLSITWPDE